MANIKELEESALHFMDKMKSYEEKKRKEMIDIIEELYKMIYLLIKRQDNISLSFLNSFIDTEIEPLIDTYRGDIDDLLNDIVNRNYDLGVTQAGRFLTLADPDHPSTDLKGDSHYEEVLLALLIYSQTLSYNLMQDLKSKIRADMTSIYIENKNINKYNPEREIEADENKTLNNILAGAIIGKYIFSTFKNIKTRADMIAMNEINRSLNHGTTMRYLKANVNHVKWVAVMDTRTCKHCLQAAHGGDGHGVYHITDIDPPPLHSRCRCILIPYNKLWDQED